MDYDEALTYLQGRLRLGVKLGNERFLTLLNLLDNPQESLRVVHIAGTKGKGSTTAMAASVLQAAGYKVGAYLSPYVYDVRERVQINGQMIARDDFARWMTTIEPHVAALEQTELGPVTEFELKTALGLCYFAEQSVDYAVIEVGLGGRLDATNVFSNPLVTVITNIGLDHTELLGLTLGEIAGEKAGIIKPGVPCVTGVPVGGEAWRVIARVCREKDAPLMVIPPPEPTPLAEARHPSQVLLGGNGRGRKLLSRGLAETLPLSASGRVARNEPGGVTLTTPRRVLSGLHLRLRGAFQEINAAAALTALDAISSSDRPLISDEAARRGLETAWVPGRLEQVWEHPTIVLDVAHNELSAEVLAEALRDQFDAGTRRLTLIVGLSRHHAPEPFLAPLATLRPYRLIATEPRFRPRPTADIADAARHCAITRVEVIETGVTDAVRVALADADPTDLICVTGSFYTVGDVPPTFWAALRSEFKS